MKTKVLTTIFALGFWGLAAAQGAPNFEEVDTNDDNMINAQEASTVVEIDFSAADANQDGHLDRAEYEAAASAE
jgi:hypothetical protein